MKIAVCVKQIPDPATPYELDAESHFVVRPQDQVLDDTDRYGVEVGLQLAEANEGTVTLFSMSPSGSLQGIRQALAMGADKAVLIDDDTLRGSAALTTARVLAAAIEREGFDLVIAGTESTDGSSGVVPQQIAEILDVPALSFARHVEAGDGKVTIERQTASGYDVVESPLPAVLAVTSGSVEPRYPTFKGIMGAKQKPIDTLTAGDLGFGSDDVGIGGAGQDITAVAPIASRQAGEIIDDDGEAHLRIIALLQETKVI
ncbi:MAG: electron transfer flavoprotein subunit beta/FixA family protein [Acidimicrobiia bacterium]|nr:MAG: electron transfer flavoprotein subunit beta/FixA family protein [Acidimicrobiia bacterium]